MVDETKYPYTLDKPIEEAINIAFAANDNKMVKILWDLFVSYRKSNYKNECLCIVGDCENKLKIS